MIGKGWPQGYEGNEMVQGIVLGKTILFYFCRPTHNEPLGVEFCHQSHRCKSFALAVLLTKKLLPKYNQGSWHSFKNI